MRVCAQVGMGAGLLVLGLGVGAAAGWNLRQQQEVTAAPVRVASGPGGLPFGAKMPDAGGPVRAAVGFVRMWARPHEGWHAAVRALATPELAVALDATDPARLPDADPTGAPQVRSLAEGSAMVAVPLSTGRTVVVTVVASGGVWLVGDVEPDVGN